jgi:signal transduction histidine kinase
VTHPLVVDLAIGSAVAVVPLVIEGFDVEDVGAHLDLADVLVSALAFALILLRRHAPLPVLGVSLLAAVVGMVPADDDVVLRVVACFALYTVASTSSRAVAWAAGAFSAAVLYVALTLTSGDPWYDGDNLEALAWTGIFTAVGDAVRSRRAYLEAREERAAALRDRAERAEQALEEEARRQVVEERLRIARELHDVVAHHLAVINVQAGVASHLLHDDPSGAEDALVHVRRGVSGVLDEIGGILSVLRRPDDQDPSVDPLPTLDQLGPLVDSFSGAGLEVEWHTSGARQDVPPAVGLAAYRIVQESLTNAHRHGRGDRAVLSVDHAPGTLRVEVVNDVPAAPAATASPISASPIGATARRGHGILGMRERVAAAGGTLEVGPTGDGRFRVLATFPLIGDDR